MWVENAYYSRSVIVPTMSWQNSTPPSPPKELKFETAKLNWQPVDHQPVRSWTLKPQNGDSLIIQRILSAATTSATVQAGTYAVCAVDKLGNESAGVIITVS
jgi:hypothetical protein